MKAYINDEHRVAYVATDSVEIACSLGTWFAKSHPDLGEEGWVLSCVETDKPMSRRGRREVCVLGVSSLADAILEGPPCTHSCPQHPEREVSG